VTHRDPDAADRLLAAALTEFALHGQAGGRTERIARRAGVNKQLIHYYFRTKAGMYHAVLARAADAVAGALGRLPLVGLTAVERLRRLVRGQFDFFLSHPEHTALLVRAGAGGDWADVAIRPVAELLRDGQATGFFRDDVEPETHARLALVLTLGYFAVGPVTARWGTPTAWRDQAADLIVRGSCW
jgi:AcrR family transcriptional regulator